MVAICVAVGFILMAAHKWAPDKLSEAPAWTAWAVGAVVWALTERGLLA